MAAISPAESYKHSGSRSDPAHWNATRKWQGANRRSTVASSFADSIANADRIADTWAGRPRHQSGSAAADSFADSIAWAEADHT